jgi:lysophospholipase L1-like esterase
MGTRSMSAAKGRAAGTRSSSGDSYGRIAISLFFAVSVLAASCAWAGTEQLVACPPFTPNPVLPESPRIDAHSRDRLAKIRASINSEPHQVLFLGDSLMERWPAQLWHENFAPLGGFNAGNDGDRTDHLLTRIQRLDIQGDPPKVVVLLIGTNDLGHGRSPEAAAEGVRANLLELRGRLPQARILLLGLLPRWDRFGQGVAPVNRLIGRCNGGAVTYTDLGTSLLDQGRVSKAISPDGVHLSEAGYARLANGLKPLIGSLLGLPPTAIPIASAASQQSIDAETVFWLSIPPNAGAAEYEEYLRQFPQGRFASAARNRLIALRSPPTPAAPAAPSATDPEATLWQAIVTSGNAADFDHYLRDYPQGRFASLARNRLAQLRGDRQQATAAASRAPEASRQASTSPAEELVRKGEAALRTKDYGKAMRWFRQAAEQGNTRAMNGIGDLYERGPRGVEKDHTAAMAWYRKSAALGNEAAQEWLKRNAK